MKYNGKSPMNGKILKGIIIAFYPHLHLASFLSLTIFKSKAKRGDARLRQKKSFLGNFNWTFISVLNNDFRFLFPSLRNITETSHDRLRDTHHRTLIPIRFQAFFVVNLAKANYERPFLLRKSNYWSTDLLLVSTN